jgi:hypothetical protein
MGVGGKGGWKKFQPRCTSVAAENYSRKLL